MFNVDIKKIISPHIELNRNDMALCPFHDEKNPSFKVYSHIAVCFGCCWKGGAVKFLMKFFSVDYDEAIRMLKNEGHFNPQRFKRTMAFENKVNHIKARSYYRDQSRQIRSTIR